MKIFLGEKKLEKKGEEERIEREEILRECKKEKCVCMCMCGCVCVCDRERKREERDSNKKEEMLTDWRYRGSSLLI